MVREDAIHLQKCRQIEIITVKPNDADVFFENAAWESGINDVVPVLLNQSFYLVEPKS